MAYTMGSHQMAHAMVEAVPGSYEMTLNREDMKALIWGLHYALGSGQIPSCDTDECSGDDCIDSRVVSLYSGIAETLGVEGV